MNLEEREIIKLLETLGTGLSQCEIHVSDLSAHLEDAIRRGAPINWERIATMFVMATQAREQLEYALRLIAHERAKGTELEKKYPRP